MYAASYFEAYIHIKADPTRIVR